MKRYIFLLYFLTLSILQLVAQSSLKVGSSPFLFIAKDQYGKTIDLKKELKKGPVVLFFYRGSWCPYCNKQMAELEDSISLIRAKGSTVIAVTPETNESMKKIINKSKADFSIIHDEGYKIMDAYNVSFNVDSATLNRYKSMNLLLSDANGTNDVKLPVPATYIIGVDGKIRYVHYDPNFRVRVSVAELLKNLND
ncbi:MAG: AhpC/TSA family protein [Sediminibacterium sp.]|jgi:peroxiredoxin|nr:AhpC/TSA family protein [Sediminibacterium sp.]